MIHKSLIFQFHKDVSKIFFFWIQTISIFDLNRGNDDKVSNLAKPAFYSSLNFNQRSLMF